MPSAPAQAPDAFSVQRVDARAGAVWPHDSLPQGFVSSSTPQTRSLQHTIQGDTAQFSFPEPQRAYLEHDDGWPSTHAEAAARPPAAEKGMF